MRWIRCSADRADRSSMGGKAAALARLAGAGFPVPAWFVVTPAAFESSLTDEQRGQFDKADDPQALRGIVDDVRPSAAVVRAIDDALAGIDPAAALAVRSSAVDEDGSEHSFAGQLDSFLFVPPARVAERVAAVWRSGFAERVVAYRLERGMPAPAAAPAVIVQQMVEADVSGVAFGADPVTGSRSTVLVSAVFGLGTALVGGDADADTYRVDRNGRVLERTIARKTVRHVADPAGPEGVHDEAVPPDLAERPALDDAMLLRVAKLTTDVSRHFGRPQDIEWAIAGGRLSLLQARPITSLSALADPEGARAIWDNSNIAESYSGITTPLTFTFARLAYEGVYREFCRIMKVPARVIQQNDAMFSQMLGMVRGRVYYNLLNWYRLLAMLPGFSANQRFMEQMMGVREGLPPEVAAGVAEQTWSRRQADRLRLAGGAAGLVWNHLVLRRKMGAFYTRLNDALAPPDPPLEAMRLDELTAEFRRLEARLLTRWDAPLVNDFLAMIFFGTLGKLAAKWCGGEHANLQNDLISDEGGIISAEPARRIEVMGTVASPHEAVVAALCDGDRRQGEEQMFSVPGLISMYRGYLDKFGDRCLEELKLESPTLNDDPTPLLRAIGHTARRLRSGEAPRRQHRPREGAEAVVAQALRRRSVRRVVFGWVLRNARRRVRDRENLRFERTRLFGRVRRVLVEAGKRLHAEGVLDDPRDVFYLTLDEVLSFVEGAATCDDLRGLAALRQARFCAYAATPAPHDRFETRGAVYVGNAFRANGVRGSAGDSAASTQLKGLGCCPGVVRGPVRVIRDPRGAHLRSGEILVAERTDPGWIMLFPAAAGILVERGSLLSHSAIVAREMGIPAIVSIPNVTASLADGQWVEMDGAAGTITRIDDPASIPPAAASPAEPAAAGVAV